MTKRERRIYTPEFKEQMVKLLKSGKPKNDIISEYDLTPTAFNTWIKRSQTTGSFNEKDNRSTEENELIKTQELQLIAMTLHQKSSGYQKTRTGWDMISSLMKLILTAKMKEKFILRSRLLPRMN